MVMIGIDQVKALLPVSRTTIYVLMKRKKSPFPRPSKIQNRALWRKDQVEAWLRREVGAKA